MHSSRDTHKQDRKSETHGASGQSGLQDKLDHFTKMVRSFRGGRMEKKNPKMELLKKNAVMHFLLDEVHDERKQLRLRARDNEEWWLPGHKQRSDKEILNEIKERKKRHKSQPQKAEIAARKAAKYYTGNLHHTPKPDVVAPLDDDDSDASSKLLI